MDNFLEVRHIVKRFAEHTALDDVSLSVPRGKVFGLLGPNGAGKTTLIRIINRITAPDEGEVVFDGHAFRLEDVQQIGYLPEERGLYKKMKVGEQAIFLAQLKGLSAAEARRRLTVWFNKFEIMPWWNKKLEELSKGMQQKVQFVITVLHEPQLLIFDEPFSGFDPVNAELLKHVKKLEKQFQEIVDWSAQFEKASADTQKMILARIIERIDIYRGYEIVIKFFVTLEDFFGATNEEDGQEKPRKIS